MDAGWSAGSKGILRETFVTLMGLTRFCARELGFARLLRVLYRKRFQRLL